VALLSTVLATVLLVPAASKVVADFLGIRVPLVMGLLLVIAAGWVGSSLFIWATGRSESGWEWLRRYPAVVGPATGLLVVYCLLVGYGYGFIFLLVTAGVLAVSILIPLDERRKKAGWVGSSLFIWATGRSESGWEWLVWVALAMAVAYAAAVS
jgi:hypothetical protein